MGWPTTAEWEARRSRNAGDAAVRVGDVAAICLSTGPGSIAPGRRRSASGITLVTPEARLASTKIGSVGIRIRRGASYHGLAFNVNMDLEPFQRINPCGYAGLQMTQLAALGRPDATVEETGRAFTPFLRKALDDLRAEKPGAACTA